MSLLAADDLHLAHGDRSLFSGASVAVERSDRLGIVGPNGAGKSTLLRIMAGELMPDGGRITRAKGIRLGYLAQEHGDVGDGGLLDSVISTAPGKDDVEARLAEVERALSETDDTDQQIELSQELADLTHELNTLEDEFAPHRAKRILVGLGFGLEQFEQPLSTLSGGWRMRAALAALLFQKPDVLLLDEPTNHLDMPSVHWLSGFLRSVKQAVVLTCHDREFLNAHVKRVASLELEGVRTFRGNYDEYLVQRELDLEHMEAKLKKDEQRRKELDAFVTRFKAKASKARQAQSKAKIIEKLEAERVDLPQVRRPITIKFPPCERAADPVVQVKDLAFGYDDRRLFDGQSLEVRRGERVVIVGANGAGKTTLLRLMAEELMPQGGRVEFGRHVTVGYFAQHHADSLSAHHSVLQAIWGAQEDLSQTEARSIAGAFLFSGDDVEKPVSVLSGGEKARVALARILARPGNLLLMDEPTNHLDTESADKLTESLESYDGTVVFISHNLDFARRLSTVVWDVQDGNVRTYPGSLADYLEHLSQEEAAKEAALGGTPTPKAEVPTDRASQKAARMAARAEKAEEKKRRQKLERAVAEAEAEVARLETKVADLEEKLADPETHADPEVSRKTSRRYEKAKTNLEAAMEQWTELSDELESLSQD